MAMSQRRLNRRESRGVDSEDSTDEGSSDPMSHFVTCSTVCCSFVMGGIFLDLYRLARSAWPLADTVTLGEMKRGCFPSGYFSPTSQKVIQVSVVTGTATPWSCVMLTLHSSELWACAWCLCQLSKADEMSITVYFFIIFTHFHVYVTYRFVFIITLVGVSGRCHS